MQAVLLSLPLLLFVVFSCCLKGSWSYVYNVTWTSEGVTRTNHIVASFTDQIRFYCENTSSDVFRITSKQDYDNCNVDAYGHEIGSCQAVSVYVVAVIYEEVSYPLPRYEVNTTYYYYSKQGNDCANGVKLTLTVVNTTGTSIALPTTNTGTTTGAISTTGATGGNTGTTAGTTRTTAGTTRTTAGTTGTTTVNVQVTNTPTIGGSDDGNDSLLDKVSQYYYAPVIVPIVLIVLVLLSVLTLFIVCYKRHTRKSTFKELLVKSISHEVTDTDNEIQTSTEGRVELKETKNANFVATYKRKDDSPGSVPHTNRPAPPPPPTTNSVKNAFNVESKMSSSVQSSSSRSVPATRSNGNNRVGPVASLPASTPRRQAPSAPPPPSSLGNSKRPPPPPYKK